MSEKNEKNQKKLRKKKKKQNKKGNHCLADGGDNPFSLVKPQGGGGIR